VAVLTRDRHARCHDRNVKSWAGAWLGHVVVIHPKHAPVRCPLLKSSRKSGTTPLASRPCNKRTATPAAQPHAKHTWSLSSVPLRPLRPPSSCHTQSRATSRPDGYALTRGARARWTMAYEAHRRRCFHCFQEESRPCRNFRRGRNHLTCHVYRIPLVSMRHASAQARYAVSAVFPSKRSHSFSLMFQLCEGCSRRGWRLSAGGCGMSLASVVGPRVRFGRLPCCGLAACGIMARMATSAPRWLPWARSGMFGAPWHPMSALEWCRLVAVPRF